MVVIILEGVKPSVRGELSRWMIEPRPGVFTGRIPARVRDSLWEKIRWDRKNSGGLMLYSAQTEQGFEIKSFGSPAREIVDLDGIKLTLLPTR